MPDRTGQVTLAVECGDWLRRAAALAGPAAEGLADQLLAVLSQQGISTTVTVSVPLPKIPSADGGGAPVDPVLVLQALSNAVQQAENALAPQNMVIAGGQIDSTFNLNDGVGGVALARVVFRIVPKPYP